MCAWLEELQEKDVFATYTQPCTANMDYLATKNSAVQEARLEAGGEISTAPFHDRPDAEAL